MNPIRSSNRRLAGLWLVHAALAAAIGMGASTPAQAQVHKPGAHGARAPAAAGLQPAQAPGFDRLAERADQGDPVAAHEALRIWREGRAGPVSDERLARWLRFSACGGHCSEAGWQSASGC